MTTISVQDFGWQFATRNSPALKSVSFEINSGERVLILGASGSGKSTLLKAIAGVLGEDEGAQTGDILIDGIPSRQLRGTCGLVLQDPTSNMILERVGDEVAFGLENLGVQADQIWPRVSAAVELVGLNLDLSHSTSKLSGGQIQRLAIASVLAMEPKVLALDEPTSNLDPDGVRQLTATLRHVMENTDTPVVIVEHRVDTWWDFATRIIVLGSEGVVWDGAPQTLPQQIARELERGGVWLPRQLRTTTIWPREENIQNPRRNFSTCNAVAGYLPGQPATAAITTEFVQGKIYAITGSNGSGKTAFALSLAGLMPLISGEVIADTELAGSAGANPAKWKSSQLLSRIGFVFQSPENQFIASTVAAELAVGPRALKLPENEVTERVHALLNTMQLEDLANVHPFTLSGGQQRRLSVATVLATEPQVIICDEPTFGQDANTWAGLVELFHELRNAGHCIIVVTHDEDFISAVADEVFELGGAHALH